MAFDPSEFYHKANLTMNPFRSNPTQESDPRMSIWVGYEKERQTLDKFLIRSRADQVGNTNFLLLYGDYGAGKSHALFWAKYQILENRKSEFNSVCYYIQTLRKDAKISFAGAFKEDIVAKSSIVQDVLRYKQFIEECTVEYKRDRGLGHETTKEMVLQQLIASVELFNFARDIIRCDREQEVNNLLVPRGLGDFQAMQILTRLINLFIFDVPLPSGNKRFKKGGYLFIDEVDLLATSTAKEARETNELFRHLYDNCPNCFCLALGFTATAAELNILFAPYVLSRVNKQIVMQYLDLEEAKHFVRDMLDSARVDAAGETGYAPFEESAVQNIVSQIVSITPRKVINTMQQILEEVRLLGFDPSTGSITPEYLDEHSIIEDVLGG